MRSHNAFNRREFTQHGLLGLLSLTAAGGTARLSLADQQQPAGWIDAHVHVWSPNTQQYPISKNFTQADMQPPSFTPEQLFSHSRPAGVSRIVLIQMSFYEYDHRYLVEVMRAHPEIFSGVALIDYRSDQLLYRMDELADMGMRGFRLHSRGDAATWATDPGMAKLWQHAAQKDLAVCPLINPSDLSIVDALCKKFPETTVVVDHFGRVGISGTVEQDELRKLCDLARHPNTHVKTSAFYALGQKTPPYNDLQAMIRQVVDSFSPERLMWASDCPYQVQPPHSYEASLSLIRDRCDFLSDSDKQWLLRGTAEKVFFA